MFILTNVRMETRQTPQIFGSPHIIRSRLFRRSINTMTYTL